MKKCPFCAEDIQDAAIKCKHCGEFLEAGYRKLAEPPSRPWYFGSAFIVIAICCVGPLALPLIWFRPRLAIAWKVALTVLVLALSWALYLATMKSIEMLKSYYELISSF